MAPPSLVLYASFIDPKEDVNLSVGFSQSSFDAREQAQEHHADRPGANLKRAGPAGVNAHALHQRLQVVKGVLGRTN